MRVNVFKTGLLVAVLTSLVGATIYAQAQGTGRAAAPQGRGGGGAPQNLQVLSKDLTFQQVRAQMQTIAASLGVECSHCHVGTTQERAKDDKPEKLKARKMMQLVNTINNDLLKDFGPPAAAGAQKVTCFTCHRGALKPLTAPGGAGF